MADLVIFRNENGKLEGFGDKGRRAWDKFRRLVKDLDVGETLSFSYRLPRSPRHHRFFFARLSELFERQERFDAAKPMLEWLKVGAGHCDFAPGANGTLVALPKSIDWHSLEEQDFIEFHRDMTDFLWTPHAQEYLWPHLTTNQRYATLKAWADNGGRP